MPRLGQILSIVRLLWSIIVDVVLFWQSRLHAWWNRKPLQRTINEALNEARLFEEWEAAAYQLDAIQGNDLWRQNPTSKFYDYRLIYQRLQSIIEAREEDDVISLVNLLRSGLVRNLGNITTPRLFSRAYAGTKLLIEDYVTQLALAIESVAAYPVAAEPDSGLTGQGKLDLLHDTRQAFGRTALILQGGSIFGLCHIGVVKALHLRGLLPRIIVGTATGAFVAALVGVHSEHELLDFLNGDKIDLSAFAALSRKSQNDADAQEPPRNWLEDLINRLSQWIKNGYSLDVNGLEECVRINVGDLTFEEAYAKTGRVLNITIPDDCGGDCPTLLNYLTAPRVLIRSAAAASNNPSSSPSHNKSKLLCKSLDGSIQPWLSLTLTYYESLPDPSYSLNSPSSPHESPLTRVTELFNVNHFLVSQARPYIVPFLQTGDILSHSLPGQSAACQQGWFWLPLLRIVILEVHHRLRQLDSLGLMPQGVRRFLIDEIIPAASLTLVPEFNMSDLTRMFEWPTRQKVNDWILRGERSVWPAIGALKIRCAVEVELDRAYQAVRRRKPLDGLKGTLGAKPLSASAQRRSDSVQSQQQQHLKGNGEKRKKRRRSRSLLNGTSIV